MLNEPAREAWDDYLQVVEDGHVPQHIVDKLYDASQRALQDAARHIKN
jgi:hypothetical protein